MRQNTSGRAAVLLFAAVTNDSGVKTDCKASEKVNTDQSALIGKFQ